MNHFQTYLVEEFTEDYQEGHLTRRQALKLIAGVTGSLLMANSILAGCAIPPEQAAGVTPTEAAAGAATGVATPAATQAAASTTGPGALLVTGSGTVSPDDPAVRAPRCSSPAAANTDGLPGTANRGRPVRR